MLNFIHGFISSVQERFSSKSTIPEDEQWFWNNPKNVAAYDRACSDVKEGRIYLEKKIDPLEK